MVRNEAAGDNEKRVRKRGKIERTVEEGKRG